MKLIHTFASCLLFSLLTACGGGNYDDNKSAPIKVPDTDTNPDDNDDDNNNNNAGIRKEQKISLDNADDIPETFGAGDTLYLDNFFKSDVGLPLSYEITEFYEKGICKLTGEDNNILQTIKQGTCFVTARQAGNNQYLPAGVQKEIRIPKKCPSNQRPEYIEDREDLTKSYYNCVPNYQYIYPLDDTPVGEVGSEFKIRLKGEKIYTKDKNQLLTATLPKCTNPNLDFIANYGDVRSITITCDVTQAGDSTLTIFSNGKELFSTPVIFKQPSPIPPMPTTKTGITTCANATENNIDCNNQGRLGDYYNLAQDGKVQSGVAHDYQAIYANNGDTCIQDNATGRIWEVKTDDDGLRDKDWQYHWYNTNSSTNGGNVGNAGSIDDSHLCGNTLPDGLCNSQAYIKALNDANYCGYNDWRMPTLKELISLMDYSKLDNPPVIDDVFASDTAHTSNISLRRDYISFDNYWINYSTARFGTSFRDRGEHIRAVRHIDSLAIPPNRYDIINNGTEVKDNHTNLVWQRCAIGQTWDGTTCTGDYTNFGWLEGMQQAEALGNGYRLPSIIELVSIAKPPKVPYSDGIDTDIFPNNAKRGDAPNYLTNSPSIQMITDEATTFVYSFDMVTNSATKREKGVGRGKTPVRAVRPATALD